MAKSRRLTIRMREEILDALLDHKFGGDGSKERFEKELGALGNKVYEQFMTPELMELFHKCPIKWFDESSYIDVKFGTMSARLRWPDEKGEWKQKPVPYQFRYGWNDNVMFPSNHELTKEYEEIEARRNAYNEERTTAVAEGNAALNRVTTVRKLIESWPEVEQFIPEGYKEENISILPVIRIDKLNQQFGIGEMNA
jgi:hypothetical protein